MIRRALAAIAFAVVACSDGTGPGLNGTVTFTFTGAGGGEFNVAAAAPTSAASIDANKDLTAGTINNGAVFVIAYRALGGGEGDNFNFGVNRTTLGSAPWLTDCDFEGPACATLHFSVNNYTCHLGTGTVVITQITPSRLTGTFSGTGACAGGTGSTSFAVTSGTFDVARVPVAVLLD